MIIMLIVVVSLQVYWRAIDNEQNKIKTEF